MLTITYPRAETGPLIQAVAVAVAVTLVAPRPRIDCAMSPEVLISPLSLAAWVSGLLGLVLVVAAMAALLRAALGPFIVRLLAGSLLLTLGLLAGAVTVGLEGYRALTHEDLAAQLRVRPVGPQRFTATVQFPDGRELVFDLAGDEIYVDAHILKWKPLAGMLGLHTAYELDRVGGRYRTLEQERSGTRTIHSLARTRAVDLFALRQRYTFLQPLLDAEYGSATFIAADRPADLELRVSTSGLLVREAEPVTK